MQSIDSYYSFFANTGHQEPYLHKGIWYSELFLFLWHCVRLDVDLVLESGIKNGFSTRVLRAAGYPPLLAVDFDPIIELTGVHIVKGDAIEILPEFLKTIAPGKTVGVLIDGPKGEKALRLKDTLLNSGKVRVVACHDQPQGQGEYDHSHDEAFRALYGKQLDFKLPQDIREKYPKGPGLAVWCAQ